MSNFFSTHWTTIFCEIWTWNNPFKMKYMWCLHEWNVNGRWTFTRDFWRKSKSLKRIKQKFKKWCKKNEFVFTKVACEKKKFQNKKTPLCWTFYYINNNKHVDHIFPQVMACIFCYNNPILISNQKLKQEKALILYNTINGIIVLKTHVFTNHFVVAKNLRK